MYEEKKSIPPPPSAVGCREDGVLGRISQLVQVFLPEHIALAHDARRNPDGVDGAVELGVGGRHEHLIELPSAVPALGFRRLGGLDVHDQGQLMNELVGFSSSVSRKEAVEPVHHPAGHSMGYPDVAVDDPYDLSLGLTVCAADVPDLRVWSEIVDAAACPMQQWVLLFDHNFCVEIGEVGNDLREDRVCRVGFGRNTQVDGQLPPRIVLLESRRQAVVETLIQPLDGPDDGDMGDLMFGQRGRYRLGRRRRMVSEAAEPTVSRRSTGVALRRKGVGVLQFTNANSLDDEDDQAPTRADQG